MSGSTVIPIDEVVFFDICTHNPSTQAVSDADSTPTFAVYEEATDTDIGVGGNLTKRTSLTGDYRGSFTASLANGFEVGKFYSVIATATVNSITAKCLALHFRCVPAETTVGIPDVIAAIKAKTDNLPADPADASDIATATDAIFNRIGAPVGASISADIAAVQSDTNDIQTRIPAALDSDGSIKASVKRVGTTTLTAAGTGGQGYGA
jgi:hypothetical protein